MTTDIVIDKLLPVVNGTLLHNVHASTLGLQVLAMTYYRDGNLPLGSPLLYCHHHPSLFSTSVYNA